MLGIILCSLACLVFCTGLPKVGKEGNFCTCLLAANPVLCKSKMRVCLFSKCGQHRERRIMGKQEGHERWCLVQVVGEAAWRVRLELTLEG